jgi:hypothetical protein
MITFDEVISLQAIGNFTFSKVFSKDWKDHFVESWTSTLETFNKVMPTLLIELSLKSMSFYFLAKVLLKIGKITFIRDRSMFRIFQHHL